MPQFIVMFRSRFNEAFPRGAPHVGPQDIELGVAEGTPSADVEGLLCALLSLVLNRKKPVESVLSHPTPNTREIWSHRHGGTWHNKWLTLLVFYRKGHYGRALEESIQTQKSQWPRAWGAINPLSGGRGFPTMTALERVCREALCRYQC
jgi:hypothetical protein